MAGLFSSPKMPAVAPAVAPPAVTDPSVQAASQQQQASYAMAQGAGSTVLTSGQGAATPTTTRRTLLGSASPVVTA